MRSCPSADSSVWARSCSRCLGPLSELTRTRNTLFRSDEIMIDIASGKVAYAVVSFGGFLGMGEKLFALPWSTLRVDEDQKHFILDIDKTKLENAPGFDKEHWPDMLDTTWRNEIFSYYGAKPYWDRDEETPVLRRAGGGS